MAGLGAFEAASWIGRPFPGFLVLENRVVASAGLAHWPATAAGAIYQHEVVAVDGRPLEDARALQAYVESLPPGTPVRYRLRQGEREREREVATRRFSGPDFFLLFGAYLLGGLSMGGVAIAIRRLRPADRTARGTATALSIIGLWGLTAMDLYGPYRLFRLHAALECLLFAGMVHLALVFPYPRRLVERSPRLLVATYCAAAALTLASQLTLYEPARYAATHRVAMALFGASLLLVIASQIRAYLRPPTFEARQRVKVLVLGAVASLAPGALLSLSSAASGGQTPENTIAWSGAIFPFAVGYAVLRSDLFQVDEILRRSVNYALVSGLVTLVYAVTFAGVTALGDQPAAPGRALLLALAGASVLVLLPLRDRLQAAIDRLFFRSAYDFRRVVESASERLASVAELGVIAAVIEDAVRAALQPAWISLQVWRRQGDRLRGERFGTGPSLPHALLDQAPDREAPAEGADGSLAVSFRAENRLVARLVLGRRLSGGFYGGDDRRFLKTLSHQAAVAIENALALEQLRELNRDLESKVEERTSELAAAVQDLREAQAQLVQREKLASVGQLVAGIAHEINNPLNFIEGNLHFLREYATRLTDALERARALLGSAPDLVPEVERIWREGELDDVFLDLASTFDGCEEGVKRATTIVRDLRTFSRSDGGARTEVDVHRALESTLTLLRGRLKGIRIERDFAPVPPIRAAEGALKQVFMNLLSNAADAVAEGGRITLRTRSLDAGRLRIEVEDDGCGIDPALRGRIFEPFFTTKEVGRGTGLGLSISYGVVAEHGGSIRVRSQPGVGSCFEVELPVEPESAGARGGDPAADGERA